MQIVTDSDKVIDWIVKSDDAKKCDIRLAEKKLFGITIYKKKDSDFLHTDSRME